MTSFQMPISDELLEVLDTGQLPGNMTIVGVGEISVVTRSRMLTVEDPDAPAYLEGQTLIPNFRVEGLKVRIAGWDYPASRFSSSL